MSKVSVRVNAGDQSERDLLTPAFQPGILVITEAGTPSSAGLEKAPTAREKPC
jgi:hypothetical protein